MYIPYFIFEINYLDKMSELNNFNEIFEICEFQGGHPITATKYLTPLKELLKSEQVPATITKQDITVLVQIQKELENEKEKEQEEDEGKLAEPTLEEESRIAAEAARKENQEEEKEEEEAAQSGGTTPLHAIVNSVDLDISGEELKVVESMIDTLFEWGAGWMILDENNETPGCIALRRGLPKEIYEKFVSAGVRAEVFLSRMLEDSDEEDDQEEEEEKEETVELGDEKKGDTAADQKAYLSSELEYTQHNLITRGENDGVMMDWEDPIMKRSAGLITNDSEKDGSGPVVLNVGFGMGIIDSYIQELKPKRHYICEAHPQVLAKMKADGWYEKPGVYILEGPWKKTLPKVLEEVCGEEQVYFDGLYYDTFSEHYKDLVEFYDYAVGMMKHTGTFSFFNGLGADRQICYDVYKQVVDIDLQNYGLEVKYEEVEIDPKKETWDGIKKQYWALRRYSLPVIKFMS